MPRVAAIILLGSLLAFFGNQLPDRLWSAYLPMLLLFYRFNPAWRLPLLLAAAWLWSAALLHYHLDHRLRLSHDNRLSQVRGVVADVQFLAIKRSQQISGGQRAPRVPRARVMNADNGELADLLRKFRKARVCWVVARGFLICEGVAKHLFHPFLWRTAPSDRC